MSRLTFNDVLRVIGAFSASALVVLAFAVLCDRAFSEPTPTARDVLRLRLELDELRRTGTPKAPAGAIEVPPADRIPATKLPTEARP